MFVTRSAFVLAVMENIGATFEQVFHVSCMVGHRPHAIEADRLRFRLVLGKAGRADEQQKDDRPSHAAHSNTEF